MKGVVRQLSVLHLISVGINRFSTLNKNTKIPRMSLSRILKSLSREGYIKRKTNKKNVEYSITDKGKMYLVSLGHTTKDTIAVWYAQVSNILRKVSK